MNEVPAAAVRELHMALINEGWTSLNMASVRESLTRALAAAAPLIQQATADEIKTQIKATVNSADDPFDPLKPGLLYAAGIADRVGAGGGGGHE